MGLIESDTLITVSLYDDEHEEFANKRMTIAECLDSFTEEGCPHAVEAEPVIRCKDCTKAQICIMYRSDKDPYGFCRWAARKEE